MKEEEDQLPIASLLRGLKKGIEACRDETCKEAKDGKRGGGKKESMGSVAQNLKER